LKKYINIENINKVNEFGFGLLHYSISRNSFDITKYLIESGINLDLMDLERNTALHYVCNTQNIEIAKLLLEKGADLSIRNKYGNNAMWTAVFNCKGKYYDMVELFMKYNPDIITKNKVGKSPLDFAIQVENSNLIDILTKS
jgi:uncharacterized protein